MIYSVKQVTTYRYASSVPFARHLLRLTPSVEAGQSVISSAITIDPKPQERCEAEDFFGNRVTHVAIETPHQSMIVASVAEVEVTERAVPVPSLTPIWTEIPGIVANIADASARSPVHHIFASRLVPIDATIRDYAAKSFAAKRTILEGGIDLMNRIKADFVYDTKATDVTTPPAEAFQLRRGVCQDFAHVMICGLRSLGLPAAYISGYLRTKPPPGRPRLEGADAPHAWVALWCGAEAGWQGLDPTNDVRTATDYIGVAFGRDYADVSPVDGIIVAAGDHTLSVSVDVVPREEPEEERPGESTEEPEESLLDETQDEAS
jgi:transglutaminase-like putative cysteine protease